MSDRQETKEKNIYQRLLAVMAEVSYIQKTAKIDMGKSSYKAVTHDEVTARTREVLMKHGVYSAPVKIDRKSQQVLMIKEQKEYNGDKIIRTENSNFYTEIDLVYRFTNADDPTDFIEVPSVGDGIDPQDKSAGKALSLSVKNALLKALMLETGENEESRPEGDVAPVNKALPMDRTNIPAVDKRLKEQVKELGNCVSMDDLKKTYTKLYKEAQKNGCTEDQLSMLEYQKDSTKARLEREGDDIPSFEPHDAKPDALEELIGPNA